MGNNIRKKMFWKKWSSRLRVNGLISPALYIAKSYLRNSTNSCFTRGAIIRYFTFHVQLLADV